MSKMPSDLNMDRIALIEKRIRHHADSIARLKIELAELNKKTDHTARPDELAKDIADTAASNTTKQWPLLKKEYQRYGRQLIMPEVGLQGQLRLKSAAVLVVGAGGLGCPAAAYLAGAGVGRLGIVDGDHVEESNLHRQILHGGKVGMNKAQSIAINLSELNPLIKYDIHQEHLSPDSASDIVSTYDVVLDCTDNPASRYLISDICVLLGKPLISASALRTEGQLSILNHPARPSGDTTGGPCYRCIFPVPPPADSVISCGEGGILGPVVGVMGVLQALEAVKMIANGECNIAKLPNSLKNDHITQHDESTKSPSMLLFSAYQDGQFRTIRLRKRNPKCVVCSNQASITLQSLNSGSLDYVQFCGTTPSATTTASTTTTTVTGADRNGGSTLDPLKERIDAPEFASVLAHKKPHLLLDTREQVQFELCQLPGSVNLPFSQTVCSGYETPEQIIAFKDRMSTLIDDQEDQRIDNSHEAGSEPQDDEHFVPVFVVCRLGNDSQVLVRRLKQLGLDAGGRRSIKDIKGGLRAWTREVDHEFPEY